MVTINAPQKLDGLNWRLTWSSTESGATFRVYQDGLLINTTKATTQDFSVSPGESLVVEILDDDSAPALAFPGRVLLGWYAVADTARYRVEQWDGAAWSRITSIEASSRWFSTYKTPYLADCTTHLFRVVPVGINGNDGAALELSVFMVRHPSPPAVDFSYDELSREVTINAQ